MAASGESRFITAPDGLKLHVRDYGDRRHGRLPIVCLPGLSRTAEDFAPLATAISGHATEPRRVLALDYRGRGLSDYDRNPGHYAIHVELADVIAVLVACGATPAVFVGTSRGGILAMTLATRQPGAIAGVVLNDIGPVIEAQGLKRIRGYLGKLPEPRTFEEGADILRRISQANFPNLGAADWMTAARLRWREQNGRLVATYDPALSRNFAAMNLDRPIPSMWPHFEALAGVPVMVIRGAYSDVLSSETVAAMKTRHPALDVLEIADQGHAPLLAEPNVIARIAQFAAKCDAAHAEAAA
jgi:pimeloyl-ACP methyl ester carboxylesterase